MTRIFALTAACLAIAAPHVCAQDLSTTDHAPIVRDRLVAAERFVARNWSRLGLPGVAVSVGTADSVVLAIAFGTGTRAGQAITPHTSFHIGSVTKTFTAALAAELAQRGVIDLDAPVETYLPDFTMRDPFEAGSITLRHLLRHRSGFNQWSGHDSRAQQEGRFDHLAPKRPPDEEGEYSSLNFIVLGRVIEAANGAPYARVLEDLLFEPLAMDDAFVERSDIAVREPAMGHQSYFGLQKRRMEPQPPQYLVPAGFAGASAVDMGRYGGMLVGGGEFAGVRVLAPETVAALLGPVDTAGAALGWGRRRLRGELVLEHSGNARTSSARMRLVPGAGYSIAVLANTNSGPFFDATSELLDGVHAILRGETVSDPWPKERLFKGVVLAGTILAVVGAGRRAVSWNNAGYPFDIDATSRVLGPLALDVAGAGIVLFGIPRLVGVPLPTMFEYFPDLGFAMTVSATAGVAGGLMKAFTRSAR